jgi:hypothetical protein
VNPHRYGECRRWESNPHSPKGHRIFLTAAVTPRASIWREKRTRGAKRGKRLGSAELRATRLDLRKIRRANCVIHRESCCPDQAQCHRAPPDRRCGRSAQAHAQRLHPSGCVAGVSGGRETRSRSRMPTRSPHQTGRFSSSSTSPSGSTSSTARRLSAVSDLRGSV